MFIAVCVGGLDKKNGCCSRAYSYQWTNEGNQMKPKKETVFGDIKPTKIRQWEDGDIQIGEDIWIICPEDLNHIIQWLQEAKPYMEWQWEEDTGEEERTESK